ISLKFGGNSLRARLSRQFALQTMFGLGLASVAVYVVISLTLSQRQDDLLAQERIAVERLLEEGSNSQHLLNDLLAGHEELSLTIRRRDGTLVFAKDDRNRQAGMDKRLAFVVELPHPGGTADAELIYNRRSDSALLDRLAFTLLFSALAGSLGISAGGFLLVRKGLLPLRDLVRQTASLNASKLDSRLDGSGQPDELQPLLAQFNALLERLEAAYAHMEAFNVDVAHELNTPLSNIIGTCEVELRRPRTVEQLTDVLSSNLEELRRLASIVADMLFLSHAERGAKARRSMPTSLADIVSKVVEYHEAVLAEEQLRVEVFGDAAAAVDVGLLRRALSNLVANATQYAVRGSLIEVRINCKLTGETCISVLNYGATIPAPHLPKLFDRFYRADSSRVNADRHHGLGLSIVAAIAMMHGGRAWAESNNGRTSVNFSITEEPQPVPLELSWHDQTML
ncbi:heavy metal sensor histidine kinase, partial [Acidithiobacillus sp. MC2.1]|uniref:heavy metal sensor histidine kinase n=1 Tax=Acidithiobacillus sp. MC2.2 TaxID=2801579 RepID=UPI0019CF5DDF